MRASDPGTARRHHRLIFSLFSTRYQPTTTSGVTHSHTQTRAPRRGLQLTIPLLTRALFADGHSQVVYHTRQGSISTAQVTRSHSRSCFLPPRHAAFPTHLTLSPPTETLFHCLPHTNTNTPRTQEAVPYWCYCQISTQPNDQLLSMSSNYNSALTSPNPMAINLWPGVQHPPATRSTTP